jgi:hypothetical protein
VWTWDAGLGCYRNDSGGTVLCLAETLEGRQIGARADLPINVFEWVFVHSRAPRLAREVLLNLAWNEAADLEPPDWPGYDVLATATSQTAGSISTVDDIADAVVELIALGELLLITTPVDPCLVPDPADDAPALPAGVDLSRSCPDVAYTLPAYQQWLVEHEVSW